MQRMNWDPDWVRAGSLSVVLEGFMEEVASGERALGCVGGGRREVLGEAASRWPSQGGRQAFRAGTPAGALRAEDWGVWS